MGAGKDIFSLGEMWRAIRKRWKLISLIGVGVTVAVAFYTMGQTRIYKASATLQIEPKPAQPLGREVQSVVELGTSSYWANKEYYETQYSIIRSRAIAERTANTLGLQRDQRFLQNLAPGGQPVNRPPGTLEEVGSILRSRLTVDPVKDSRLVVVSLEDADPARAQRILATLARTYVEQNLEDAVVSAGSSGDWLKGQLSSLRGQLEESELALHQYKRDKNILSVSLDDRSNMLREEMQQLSQSLTALKTDQVKLQARSAALAEVNVEDPVKFPATELLQNPLLQQMRGDYVEAKRQRDSLEASGKGAEHVLVKAAEARVSATKQSLVAEAQNIQQAASRDLSIAKRQIASLSGLFEAAQNHALDLNLLEIQYKRLERGKNNTEKLYSLVLERSKESDLTGMLRFNNIRVVDEPTIPKSPISPRVGTNLLLGAVGGFLLGFILAVGRELLDRTIKTPEDVTEVLRTNFLGLLPLSKTGKARGPGQRPRRGAKGGADEQQPELAVHSDPTSGLAEAARSVRTNLTFMSPDRTLSCLLVTSAGPSEGKTTVACCIASAMAQAGQRVLLVDCDLRRPRIHKVFNVPNDRGVTTALLHPETLEASLLDTNIPNLKLLVAGPGVPNPAELLQSDRFTHLLSDLRTRFDRIVIDSPPVVPVTDAAILSTKTDATVLVVRAFKTTRDLGTQALRTLNDVGCQVAGVVLNAVDLDRHEYGYYHYYYYKRDGYAEKGNPSAPPPA